MTQQAGAAVLGFLFWIHMEHRGNTKPSCFFKSDSKVAQKNPSLKKQLSGRNQLRLVNHQVFHSGPL